MFKWYYISRNTNAFWYRQIELLMLSLQAAVVLWIRHHFSHKNLSILHILALSSLCGLSLCRTFLFSTFVDPLTFLLSSVRNLISKILETFPAPTFFCLYRLTRVFTVYNLVHPLYEYLRSRFSSSSHSSIFLLLFLFMAIYFIVFIRQRGRFSRTQLPYRPRFNNNCNCVLGEYAFFTQPPDPSAPAFRLFLN